MNNPYIGNATSYLIDVFLGLFIFALLLRFMLQWVRGDFYNPIGEFLVKFTNPVVIPLRRIIPGFMGLDLATLFTTIAFSFAKSWLLLTIAGAQAAPFGLFIYTLAELLKLTVYIFMGAIIIRIVASWIAPQATYSPIMSPVYALSEPLMSSARRVIPDIGGIDLSPILVFVFLNLTQMLAVAPLYGLAQQYM